MYPINVSMRPFILKFSLVGFLLACASSAWASAASDLPSLIQEVDRKHPLIQAKKAELSAAESSLSAARQQRLPSLSIITNRSSLEGSKTYATTRLQQPLYAGGRITAGIDQAQARIDEAQAVLGLTRKDLMSRTAAAFYEALKGQSRLAIAEKSVLAHQLLRDSIGRRVGAEVSPQSDLMLTQSRLLQAQTERAQIALALERARNVLQELLERAPPSLATPPDQPAVVVLIGQAIEEALAYAPEIQQFATQESIATHEIDLQKSAGLPNIFLRYENLSRDRDPGLVKDQAYLGLEFVPGAGLSAVQQIKAAESRRIAAMEAKRAGEKEVRERIVGLYTDIASLRLQVDSARQYTKVAFEVSQSFARQFTIGRKTWVEVLNATREYFQAELIVAELDWNLKLSELRLDIETGRIRPD